MTGRLLDASVEEWIHRLCDRWHIPGMSVTVVKHLDGDVTEQQSICHGLRNAQQQPYTDESLFGIASCSKLITAYALGMLINDDTTLPNGKKLEWTTKVQDVLPEWKLSDEYATKDIDLIDLLSFRTGLPGHDRALTSASSDDQLALLPHLPLSASIRQLRQYSNLSSNIGALIVARLSGQAFADFVKERIFLPLGMESTTYDVAAVVNGGQTVGCWVQDTNARDAKRALWAARMWAAQAATAGAGELDEADMDVPSEAIAQPKEYKWERDPEVMRHHEGCGGIWTTSSDWGKWLTELLDPSLLPSASPARRLIFSPHSIPYTAPLLGETGFYTYGLGAYLLSWRGRPAYFHAGGLPGQYSVQYVLPLPSPSGATQGSCSGGAGGEGAGWAIAVHCNEDTWGPWVNQVVARSVMDTLLGVATQKGAGRAWERRVMDMGEPSMGSAAGAEMEAGKGVRRGEATDGLDIAGVYTHPAYPHFDIRPLEWSDPVVPYLPTIARRLSTPLHISRSDEAYIARLPSIFVQEVLFVRSPLSDRSGGSSTLFRWIATKLYPVIGPDGAETGAKAVPFVDGDGTCVFTEEGLGMGGDWWVSGGKAGREMGPEMGKGECEVWYDRKRPE